MLTKTKIDIQGISSQHCVKTVTSALRRSDGVKRAKLNLRKNEVVVKYDSLLVTAEKLKNVIVEVGFKATEISMTKSFSFLTASLASFILLIGVAGCSDTPYTGPILSVDNVDRYHDSTGHDTICLQDGFDTICLKIVEVEKEETQDLAILEIHPESVNYVFFYDKKPILEASMSTDTTELVQELIDSGIADMHLGSSAHPSGSIANSSDSWTIQVYYPDSFPETERGLDPETSGFDIKVVEGSNTDVKKNEELELKLFRQRDKDDGSRVAEFQVYTQSKKITIQVDGLVSDYTVIFYIDFDTVGSAGGTNKLHLEPK